MKCSGCAVGLRRACVLGVLLLTFVAWANTAYLLFLPVFVLRNLHRDSCQDYYQGRRSVSAKRQAPPAPLTLTPARDTPARHLY